MKKILFVATVTRHINAFHIPYLKWFKEQGYEVHVASNGDEEIEYCDKHFNLQFERNPLKVNNIKVYKELKNILNENNYEIVHCHTPVGGALTRLAAKKVRKNGTRVIYTAHGFHFYKGAPLLNWLVYYPIEKLLAKHTDCLITINTEDYEIAKKKFKKCKQIELVHGVGISKDKFNIEISTDERKELRKSLNLEDNDFVIIYVAELSKRKNQSMIIEAIKELNNPKVKLLLVGKDSLNGEYQKLVKEYALEDKINFLGFRKDIPQLMKISDLCVSTSRQEGLPVNIMEAMMIGLPIIATNCRGNRDLVENEKNGYIVEKEKIKDIVQSIKELLNNIDRRKEFIRNGKKIIEIYEINKVIKELTRIYKINSSSEIKVLFIHSSEKLKEDEEENYYTDGSYSEDVWKRYFTLSKDLTVIFRKDPNIYTKEFCNQKFQFFDKEKIKFVEYINQNNSFKSFINNTTTKSNKELLKTQIYNSDLIILRLPDFAANKSIKYIKKYNKPYLAEVVGCGWNSLWYHSFKGKILAPLIYLEMKKIIKNAKYVLYVSCKFLQNKYPNNKKNIACSDVMIETVDDTIFKNRISKIEGNSCKKIVLGTIGALDVKYKRQEYVIKAIAELNKHGYNFEYQLIGAGCKKRLEQITNKLKINDKVKFLGSKPHCEVLKWLDNIDIYIQPSDTEGLSRALIEAMSRACTCIASSAGGNPELIDKDYIFKRGKYNKLVNILKNIQNEKMKEQAKINFEKAKKFEKSNLDIVRKKFFENIIEENFNG